MSTFDLIVFNLLYFIIRNFSIKFSNKIIHHYCFTNHLKLIKIYKKKFSLNIIKSTIVLNQKLKTGFHVYIFNSIIFPARISTNPILNEIITGACAPIVIVSFSLSPISQARARSRSLMLSARDEIIFNPPSGEVRCSTGKYNASARSSAKKIHGKGRKKRHPMRLLLFIIMYRQASRFFFIFVVIKKAGQIEANHNAI